MSIMSTPNEGFPLRSVIESCGATLLAYVGLIHEFVGLKLEPGGAEFFGGVLGWYLAGALLTTAGLLILGEALGLLRRIPVVFLASAFGLGGATVVASDLIEKGTLHFFGLTTFLASILVIGSALTAKRAA